MHVDEGKQVKRNEDHNWNHRIQFDSWQNENNQFFPLSLSSLSLSSLCESSAISSSYSTGIIRKRIDIDGTH